MSLYLLFGSSSSKSSTAIGVFFIGIVIFIWSLIQKKRRCPTIILHALLFGVIASVLIFSSFLEYFVTLSGRDMTFTGRTEIWSDVLQIASKRPILGVGYGSLWLGDKGYYLYEKHYILQAHNGYIEIYAELGIIGLIIVALIIIQTYRNIFKTIELDISYGFFRLIYFIMILAQNITESTLLKSSSMTWFLFVVVAIQPLNLSKQVESKINNHKV